jgi:hypothetical protein
VPIHSGAARRGVFEKRRQSTPLVIEKDYHPVYSSEAYFSLEGCRRLNTFKVHSDKTYLRALLNRKGFSNLSEPGQTHIAARPATDP